MPRIEKAATETQAATMSMPTILLALIDLSLQPGDAPIDFEKIGSNAEPDEEHHPHYA
jgi:hypothetical protein